jgi:hypothetical protein
MQRGPEASLGQEDRVPLIQEHSDAVTFFQGDSTSRVPISMDHLERVFLRFVSHEKSAIPFSMGKQWLRLSGAPGFRGEMYGLGGN